MGQRPAISVPATIQGFKPMADRSWRITVETRELSGDEVKLLADNFQGEGWLLFSPNEEISVESIPTEAADSGVKTPSERLRSKLFVLWKQKGSKGDFESYYRTAYQKLEEQIVAQLQPREET